MKKTIKKSVSLLLVVIMVFSVFAIVPITASASDDVVFVKVTEEPDDWSGDYLIVYEGDDGDDSVAFNGGAGSLNAAGNLIDVTISDGKIASDAATAAAKVTIAQIDGGYSIKTADDIYIGGQRNANKIITSDVAILNTISYDDDGEVNCAIIVSNDSYLRYNTGWGGFRYYKSVQQEPVQLYKYTEPEPEPTTEEPTTEEPTTEEPTTEEPTTEEPTTEEPTTEEPTTEEPTTEEPTTEPDPNVKNGPMDDGFFYLNDVRQNAYQLIEYNGDYYFISDGHMYAKNVRLYMSECFTEGTNITPGYYDFDDSGKLTVLNGLTDDGYFYVNGVMQSSYQLIEIDGDYYFINDNCKIAKNQRIYLGAEFLEETDLQPGYYDFDSDGKMDLKSGPMDDGYFYLNGARQNAYQLIEYRGDYYFISDCNKYAKNVRLYMSESFTEGTNITPGYYDFDESGKLTALNGLTDDGYYYKDGVLQNAYQLIEIDGDYYFISDNNKIAKNQCVYLSEGFIGDFGLQPGYYDFDSEGRMDLKSGPMDDGYFYLNGARQNAYKIIKYNGKYYFISDCHKYAKNVSLYIGESFTQETDLVPGYYDFNEDGFITNPTVILIS